jgi:hypothetical protein
MLNCDITFGQHTLIWRLFFDIHRLQDEKEKKYIYSMFISAF